jgi:hypothetical protein
MRGSIRKALLVTVWGVVVPLTAFTALMGYAHTKAGRPLLGKIMPVLHAVGMKGPSCPLGYDVALTAGQKEQARQSFAASHRGTAVAGERPALGFELDRTTSADVLAWAKAKGVACVHPQKGYDLDCSNVSAAALPGERADAPSPALSSLWMTFGEGDRLIALVALRRDRSPEPITQTFVALESALGKADGPAAATTGDPTAAYLSLGALRQASAEFRFQNYYVMTRATNMGHDFVLSEEYRSL